MYIGHDASVPFKVGTLGPHTVLLITISCPIIFAFPWISSKVWNLFPFKGDFSFKGDLWEKSEVTSGLQRRWFTWGIWCFAKNSAQDAMNEWVCCRDEAANHQLPIAAAFLNHPNSFHKGMFNLNAKFVADSLLYSLSNFECDDHTIHMLPQWHQYSEFVNIDRCSFRSTLLGFQVTSMLYKSFSLY